MRAVAAATGYGTSAVSAQLAALERDLGVELIEQVGRNVRLTAAGRQLVGYAEQVLALVEAARTALHGTESTGLLRVGAFASVLSADIVPVVQQLAVSLPGLRLELQEREPTEVMQLLADDRIDLGFVDDYSLVPRFRDDGALRFIFAAPLVLAVPTSRTAPEIIDSPQGLASVADLPWVVNSRGDDDGELVDRVCAASGIRPDIVHKVDSLELILEFVAADLGIALVPASVPAREGVNLVPMSADGPLRRTYAATRPGRQDWPASALVTQRVTAHAHGIT
ncbi:MAG TPA: LysR substrate-binding domain-containing protein [Actinomycetes bacterium]|jgi:DNA-binding transcriptional LysR family regulator